MGELLPEVRFFAIRSRSSQLLTRSTSCTHRIRNFDSQAGLNPRSTGENGAVLFTVCYGSDSGTNVLRDLNCSPAAFVTVTQSVDYP